jgi:hypothetical protein
MITGEAVFIVAAYAGVGLGTLGLIAFAIWDARRVGQRLKALELRGIHRRGGGQ